MIVFILENASQSLRGEMSRWLIEPKAGVFIGRINAMVREKLWEKCKKSAGKGSVVMIWSDSSEQGFSMRAHGIRNRESVDKDGITLILELDESNLQKS